MLRPVTGGSGGLSEPHSGPDLIRFDHDGIGHDVGQDGHRVACPTECRVRELRQPVAIGLTVAVSAAIIEPHVTTPPLVVSTTPCAP